jgi:hypothetical protein
MSKLERLLRRVFNRPRELTPAERNYAVHDRVGSFWLNPESVDELIVDPDGRPCRWHRYTPRPCTNVAVAGYAACKSCLVEDPYE